MSELAYEERYPITYPAGIWVTRLGHKHEETITATSTATNVLLDEQAMRAPFVDSRTVAPTIQSDAGLSSADLALPVAFTDRIRSFELPRNWDEEDAPAITRRACEAAIRLAEVIRHRRPDLDLPRAAPSTVRGAVALTWRVPGASFTVFVRRASFRRLAYQWEGGGHQYQAGEETYAWIMRRFLQM